MREDINVGASADEAITVRFDADKERMNLAKWILLVLLLITFVAFNLHVYKAGAEAKGVFDFYKVAIPPIATLILGAYFKSNRDG